MSVIAAGRWFSLGTQVSSANKTDRHHITEILLKVALNTINPNLIIKCLTLPHFCVFLKCMVSSCGGFFYHYFISIAVGDSIIKREVLGSH